MDDKPTKQLTAEQRTLLTKARDRIQATPKSYDQRSYGTGSSDRRTPGCVAGHIVADNAELRERLAETIEETDVTDERGLEYVEAEIHEIATSALGTTNYPVLFNKQWPVAWLRNNTSDAPDRRRRQDSFVPTPNDAIKVLDGILEGRIQEALRNESATAD